MKRGSYHFSLFIVVPIIFAGIAFISAIVAYRITEHYLSVGTTTPYRSVVFWSLFIASVAYVIGLFVVRHLLKPAQVFLERARQLPVFSNSVIDDMDRQVDRLEQYNRIFEQATSVLSKVDVRQLFPQIVGESHTMRGLLGQVMKVAPMDSTVLIMGGSGTGKELIATSIFEHSARKDKPFIKLNCAAIPEGLLESELFGHEKGAFTGADGPKKGRFEMANGGTLFLDEIGDMPLATQAKILRVLQEQEFERVGGTRTIRVDVRFIAATNQNLEKLTQSGEFREDLFYRLNVFTLHIPTLNERSEDIPLLINHFLNQLTVGGRMSPQAIQMMMTYAWPGNVRELKNAVERAVVLSEDGLIDTHHLPAGVALAAGSMGMDTKIGGGNVIATGASLDDHLQQIEQNMIRDALLRTRGVQVQAAKLLGINQRSLWHRIKKYNIDVRSIKGFTM